MSEFDDNFCLDQVLHIPHLATLKYKINEGQLKQMSEDLRINPFFFA